MKKALIIGIAIITFLTIKAIWGINQPYRHFEGGYHYDFQEIIVFIAFSSVLLCCVLAAIKQTEKSNKLRKYEFEHRNVNGVLEFSSFEESEAHRKAMSNTHALLITAYLFGGLSLLVDFFIMVECFKWSD